MIARHDYAGPVTKSAEAMFARAERSARRAGGKATGQAVRPVSPIRLAVEGLGLTMTILRHWEDAGVIAFARDRGRRVIDAAALERLATVAQLRRAGFTIKEIAWISDTLPPSVPAMRRALRAREDHRESARARSIARARLSGQVAAQSPAR